MGKEGLLIDLWSKVDPPQFENLLGRLLEEMGFSDVEVTGRSGDGGIDLKAIWTQTEVPGLEVDLQFRIQAKRIRPDVSTSPRVVRELKGSLAPGQWGLLITTGKATQSTRQAGLEDPTHLVSIIDGDKLVELCKKYRVGVREHYEVDLTTLEKEATPPIQEVPRKELSIEATLSRALKDRFRRIGNSPIFRSENKVLIARYSQYYERSWANYWYGITPKDLERIREYQATNLAFVCDDKGVVLISTNRFQEQMEEGNLWRSPPEGELRHYHIHFQQKNGSLYWKVRSGNIDLSKSYYPIT